MDLQYSILINSCDAYQDAWPMFFHIFKRVWKGKMPLIYLNTESKQYIDDSIEVVTLNAIDNKSIMYWGKRLIEALNRIDSEYILMLLEDFYFEKDINIDIINCCLHYLKDNPNILAFQLVPCAEVWHENYVSDKEKFPGFVIRKEHGLFRIIAGPTLWRKIDLINLTKESDTPWEWECFGSFRTWYYGKDIFCWKSKEQPIFDYDIIHGGAIHRGKWVGYKIKELAEKYEFDFDYTLREIEEDWIKEYKQQDIPPKHKRIKKIFYNRIKIIIEILYGIKLKYKFRKENI